MQDGKYKEKMDCSITGAVHVESKVMNYLKISCAN